MARRREPLRRARRRPAPRRSSSAISRRCAAGRSSRAAGVLGRARQARVRRPLDTGAPTGRDVPRWLRSAMARPARPAAARRRRPRACARWRRPRPAGWSSTGRAPAAGRADRPARPARAGCSGRCRRATSRPARPPRTPPCARSRRRPASAARRRRARHDRLLVRRREPAGPQDRAPLPARRRRRRALRRRRRGRRGGLGAARRAGAPPRVRRRAPAGRDGGRPARGHGVTRPRRRVRPRSGVSHAGRRLRSSCVAARLRWSPLRRRPPPARRRHPRPMTADHARSRRRGRPARCCTSPGSVRSGRERLRNVIVAAAPVPHPRQQPGRARRRRVGAHDRQGRRRHHRPQPIADALTAGSSGTFDLTVRLDGPRPARPTSASTSSASRSRPRTATVSGRSAITADLPALGAARPGRPCRRVHLAVAAGRHAHATGRRHVRRRLRWPRARPRRPARRLCQAGEQLGRAGAADLGRSTPTCSTARPSMSRARAATVRVAGDGTAAGHRRYARPPPGWISIGSATAASEVVALPYADPDITALRRGGLSADVTNARDGRAPRPARSGPRPPGHRRRGLADRRLHRPGDPGARCARRAPSRGSRRPGAAHPSSSSTTRRAGRARCAPASGPLAALLADHVLTDLLRRRRRAARSLAAQRFLAETAMITAELPSTGTERVILVAPPRRWNPAQEFLDRLVGRRVGAPAG